MQTALPEELRAALDAYRKNRDNASWTALSQVEVGGMEVLDALKLYKPDFPDAYPLPVEDIVQDNAGFYQWPELPNPDDVFLAITAVLKPS